MKQAQKCLYLVLGFEWLALSCVYVTQFFTSYDLTVLSAGLLLIVSPLLIAGMVWAAAHGGINKHSSSLSLWVGAILVLLSIVIPILLKQSPLHTLLGDRLEVTTYVFWISFFVHAVAVHHLVKVTDYLQVVLVTAAGVFNISLLAVWVLTRQVPFDLTLYLAVIAGSFLITLSLATQQMNKKLSALYVAVLASLLVVILLVDAPVGVMGVILLIYGYVFLIALPKTESHVRITMPMILGCVLFISILISSPFSATKQLPSEGVLPFDQIDRMIDKGIIRNPEFKESLFGSGLNSVSHMWFVHKKFSLESPVYLTENPHHIYSSSITAAVTSGLFGVLAWITFTGLVLFYLVRTHASRNKNVLKHLPRLILGFFALLFLGASVLSHMGAFICFFFLALSLQSIPKGVWKLPKRPILLGILMLGLLLCMAVFIKITFSVYAANDTYDHALNELSTGKSAGYVNQYFSVASEAYPSALIQRNQSQYLQFEVRKQLAAGSVEQSVIQSWLEDAIESAAAAVAANRYDYENWLVLGNAYFILVRLGQESAVESMYVAYDKAYELAPRQPKVAYVLARAAYALENYEMSQKRVNESLQMHPQYPSALALNKALSEKLSEMSDL